MNQDPLDDAIDRTVRDMTHVAADDDAVARVMARLREANERDASAHGASAGTTDERWMFTPRLAWAGAAAVAVAVVLIAIVVTSYSLRSSDPDARVPRVAVHVTVPATPSSSSRAPLAAREIPTPAAGTPSTMHATTARVTHGRVVRPSSVASDAADASERQGVDAEPEPPLESDIAIASITPAPLPEAPAIVVEPLITSSLQVEAIPLPSIEMPPVIPARQK
jgi:hypothetical protein